MSAASFQYIQYTYFCCCHTTVNVPSMYGMCKADGFTRRFILNITCSHWGCNRIDFNGSSRLCQSMASSHWTTSSWQIVQACSWQHVFKYLTKSCATCSPIQTCLIYIVHVDVWAEPYILHTYILIYSSSKVTVIFFLVFGCETSVLINKIINKFWAHASMYFLVKSRSFIKSKQIFFVKQVSRDKWFDNCEPSTSVQWKAKTRWGRHSYSDIAKKLDQQPSKSVREDIVLFDLNSN